MLQNKKQNLSVGILAGGKSSRMGENKALLKIGNERIIDRLERELGGFSELIVSAAKCGEYEGEGHKTVYDTHNDIGPIEGIRAVLNAAENDCVFICAADMPNITADFVKALAQFICSDYDCYVITDEDHIQPLCAIYKKSVLPVIEELIAAGKYRLRMIFDRVNTKYIPLGILNFNKKTVKNLNTREDYIEALKPFVFCVSGQSNTGKTSLIAKLINEFIAGGMSVCVLKHDGHDAISDKPGSDTDKFYRAGAVISAAFCGEGSIIHRREKTDVYALLDRIRSEDDTPDVVIIEGMKNSSFPKIETVRRAVGETTVCDPETLICYATENFTPENSLCPVYGLDDVREIFLRICKYFGI